MVGRRTSLLLAVGLLVATVTDAAAQDGSIDEAKAQYGIGYQALQRGDYESALKHYQLSYELAPRARTLFNIAVAEEHLGRLEDALRHYAQFLDVAEERDESFATQARQKIVELAKKLPQSADPAPPPVPAESPPPPMAPKHRAATPPPNRGILRVHSNLSGALVSVDGLIVGATTSAASRGETGAAMDHNLTAGDHDVIVERTGTRKWHQRLHVAAGELVRVDVAFRNSHPTRSRILTWSLAGVGTVSIAAGATLGVLALRDVTSADPSDHSRGKTRATVTDILLIGGAAALYGAWRLGHRPETSATVHRSSQPAEVNP